MLNEQQIGPSFTRLPLCGLKQLDYEPFRYLFLGQFEGGIEIGVTGTAQAYLLKEFDFINLQISFRKKGGNFYSKGHIRSIRSDPNHGAICQIAFIEEPLFEHPLYLALEEEPRVVFDSTISLREWLINGLREWLFLKQGVFVYVRHLAAYFSRVVGYHHKTYGEFRRFFFDDIMQRLRGKIEKLKAVLNDLKTQKNDVILENWLNFEESYEFIASEVNLDLLNITFEEGFHLPYVVAIKELESKLYAQFNTMLVVYEWFMVQRASEVEVLLQKKIEEKAEVEIEQRKPQPM